MGGDVPSLIDFVNWLNTISVVAFFMYPVPIGFCKCIHHVSLWFNTMPFLPIKKGVYVIYKEEIW